MEFQISLELSHQCPLDDIQKQVQLMEEMGFYRVWVPDTLVSPWDAWLAADHIRHLTSKLNIGLGVTNPHTRHPVVMAQMAATFQRLSGNRLAIALGKGIGRFLDKAGITPQSSAMVECADLLAQLISGKRVDFSGSAFQIHGIHLRTLPPEVPVPIYLAATSPGAWRTALSAADGANTFWSPETAEFAQQARSKKDFHTAAMVPFTLSEKAAFRNTIKSLENLKGEIKQIQAAGFDEAIIAYSDAVDIEAMQDIF